MNNGTCDYRRRRLRGRAAMICLVALLGSMGAIFLFLQLFSGDTYALLSSENRLRAVTVTAPRGTIYDRYGQAVADNVSAYDVSLQPGPADSMRATIERLAGPLALSPARQEELLAMSRERPNDVLLARSDADFEQVAFIEEQRRHFRQVEVRQRPRRRYLSGPAVAHTVGYLAEIGEAELATPEFAGYSAGQSVGRMGLEAQYEHQLAGRNGFRYVEVNALGAIVRELGAGAGLTSSPGQDMHLGLDLDLQMLANSIFPEGMRGGVVALDPATGEVIVLYSHPTFDPNAFIGGISDEAWDTLREDPGKPLLNRVSMSAYPPGSTWKLVISAVGMKTGDLTIDTWHTHPCAGGLSYQNRYFRCWRSAGHDRLQLAGAIKESCNVWFYQAGQQIGLDPLLAEVGRFGFAGPSGIDLPSEAAGQFPPSRAWYDEAFGRGGWFESEIMNLSIGQGANAQTLLTMAQFYAAIAAGDPAPRPHLVQDERLAARRVDWRLDLPEAQRNQLVDAMVRVVNEPGGTAYSGRLERWTLAGKTGTAQNPHGEPHSWFVGFAPAYAPRVVVAAIVEHGHPDGTPALAVPLASQIVGQHLARLGIPPEETPGVRPVTLAVPAAAAETDDGAAGTIEETAGGGGG